MKIPNIINLNKDKARKTFVISDIHYDHDKPFLYEKRGFATITDHNKSFENWWYNNVTYEDDVINLGDSCFNDGRGEKFDKLSLLPCRSHYYIWGNHNSGAKQAYQEALYPYGLDPEQELYPVQWNNIRFLGFQAFFKYNSQIIFASHFPSLIWDAMNKNPPVIAISGHSHGSCSLTSLGNKEGKILDVGVENALKYNRGFGFTMEDILSIMKKKTVKFYDHHNDKGDSR